MVSESTVTVQDYFLERYIKWFYISMWHKVFLDIKSVSRASTPLRLDQNILPSILFLSNLEAD